MISASRPWGCARLWGCAKIRLSSCVCNLRVLVQQSLHSFCGHAILAPAQLPSESGRSPRPHSGAIGEKHTLKQGLRPMVDSCKRATRQRSQASSPGPHPETSPYHSKRNHCSPSACDKVCLQQLCQTAFTSSSAMQRTPKGCRAQAAAALR